MERKTGAMKPNAGVETSHLHSGVGVHPSSSGDYSIRRSSTRRFIARPAAVAFVVIGWSGP